MLHRSTDVTAKTASELRQERKKKKMERQELRIELLLTWVLLTYTDESREGQMTVSYMCDLKEMGRQLGDGEGGWVVEGSISSCRLKLEITSWIELLEVILNTCPCY